MTGSVLQKVSAHTHECLHVLWPDRSDAMNKTNDLQVKNYNDGACCPAFQGTPFSRIQSRIDHQIFGTPQVPSSPHVRGLVLVRKRRPLDITRIQVHPNDIQTDDSCNNNAQDKAYMSSTSTSMDLSSSASGENAIPALPAEITE